MRLVGATAAILLEAMSLIRFVSSIPVSTVFFYRPADPIECGLLPADPCAAGTEVVYDYSHGDYHQYYHHDGGDNDRESHEARQQEKLSDAKKLFEKILTRVDAFEIGITDEYSEELNKTYGYCMKPANGTLFKSSTSTNQSLVELVRSMNVTSGWLHQMISWTNWSADQFSFLRSASENYRRMSDESSTLVRDLRTMACDLGPTQPPRAQLIPCNDTHEESAEEDPELLAGNTVAKIQRLIHNEICELLSTDASALSA